MQIPPGHRGEILGFGFVSTGFPGPGRVVIDRLLGFEPGRYFFERLSVPPGGVSDLAVPELLGDEGSDLDADATLLEIRVRIVGILTFLVGPLDLKRRPIVELVVEPPLRPVGLVIPEAVDRHLPNIVDVIEEDHVAVPEGEPPGKVEEVIQILVFERIQGERGVIVRAIGLIM